MAARGSLTRPVRTRIVPLVLAGSALAALVASSAGCADPRSHAHGVYVLVDTSGSYTEELRTAERVVDYLLGILRPGDAVAVANVGSRSFSEREIIARASLDPRPSLANTQKRRMADEVADYLKDVEPSRHTDITGGLIQAAQYLREAGTARKTVYIVSDLEEDLDDETIRDLLPDLDGIRVVAVHVSKLPEDNRDPRRYLTRLDAWERRMSEAGAAEWRVINELENLQDTLPERG
jgi:hypothetical protein